MRTRSRNTSVAETVAGTARRRRKLNTGVRSLGSEQSQVIKYNTLSVSVASDGSGNNTTFGRYYVPGNSDGMASTVGPIVASYYSTGKFLPGTMVEWVPSVGFTTSGRVFVGFTDNPEVAASISALGGTVAYIGAVKSLGDVITFPVYQTEKWQVPAKLRRKMFDTNGLISSTDPNVLDRSMQTFMFVAIEGAPINTTLGGFRYTDHLLVEGLHGRLT